MKKILVLSIFIISLNGQAQALSNKDFCQRLKFNVQESAAANISKYDKQDVENGLYQISVECSTKMLVINDVVKAKAPDAPEDKEWSENKCEAGSVYRQGLSRGWKIIHRVAYEDKSVDLNLVCSK